MIEKRFGEKKFSSSGMYIRSASDIPPNWNDMRSIADIPKLGDFLLGGLKGKNKDFEIQKGLYNIHKNY